MFRKLFAVLTLVLALPVLANATVYWTVKASTAPKEYGTVNPAGFNNYTTPSQADRTFTVTPLANYKVSAILVNNVDVKSGTGTQTVNVKYKPGLTILQAQFVANKFSCRAGSVIGGSITSSTAQLVNAGDSKSFTILPAPGKRLLTVTDSAVGNVPVTNANGMVYTINNVQADRIVTATFGGVTANAGLPQNVKVDSTVTLKGAGTAFNAPTYEWTLVYAPAGSAVTSASLGAVAQPTFTADKVGTYNFKLKVTDSVDATASAVSYTAVSVYADFATAATAVLNQCVVCHTANGTEFTGSNHWNNARNVQTTGTCAAACHFKSQTTAVACNTCHAVGQFTATGTVQNATLSGMDAPVPTAATTCYVCHSGSKHGVQATNFDKSSHNTGAHAKLYYNMDKKACVACHNPHSTEAAFFVASTATTVKAGKGCEACHKLGSPYGIYNADGTGKAPHFGGADTDFGAESSFITTGGATCFDCHGHNNTINAGWAEGGHGDVTAVPWKSDSGHTWNAQGSDGVNYKLSPNKTNCIRCHTSRGFKAYVESGFTNINKIYLADGVTVSKASAPLTCDGCHSSAEGALRLANFTTAANGNKGYVAFYGYSNVTYATKKLIVTSALGDNKNSNICMPCHAQRTNGELIKAIFANPAAGAKNIGSNVYPHDAQPGAVFYGKGGYEFASAATYTDRARHQRIGNYGTPGSTGYNNTGAVQGSCVACHYNVDSQYGIGTHALEAVKFEDFSSAAGKVTSARIISTTCAKCHPADFTVADVAGKKEDFDAAVKALENLLIKKGITQQTANGLTADTTKILQSRASMDMSLGSNDLVKAEKNAGAWYNWFLFSTADKGAYAHNPSYARRLIYDSIDWLDDYNINGSSSATILAMANVATSPYYNPTAVSAATAANAVKFANDPGCLGCHFGTGSTANGEVVPGIEQAPHFNTGTFTNGIGEVVTKAQYVTPNAQCNYCHGIGHGTDSPGGTILEDYEKSAHGETNGEAWTHYDFKQADRVSCQMCHTTTGFIKYVTNNFKVPAVAADSWGTTGDATKEVLACNACHASTTWKTSVRSFATYSAPYGLYNAKYNASMSNLCIVCHSGQANKAIVDSKYAANVNNTNVGLVNSHYLAAATTLYKTSGYTFYADGAKYSNPSYYKHDKLGMNNYSSVSYTDATKTVRKYDYSQNTGDTGPCVACHMNGKVGGLNTKSHSLNALDVSASMPASNGAVVTPAGQGCYGCHATENMGVLLEEQKEGFQAALNLLKQVFAANGVDYDPGFYPYFFGTGLDHHDRNNGTKNWTFMNTKVANGSAKLTHGAAFNLNLLSREPGAFVHNRVYSKRLIYDSLDYLQNGVNASGDVNGTVNFSAFSSATVPVSAARAYLGSARP